MYDALKDSSRRGTQNNSVDNGFKDENFKSQNRLRMPKLKVKEALENSKWKTSMKKVDSKVMDYSYNGVTDQVAAIEMEPEDPIMEAENLGTFLTDGDTIQNLINRKPRKNQS